MHRLNYKTLFPMLFYISSDKSSFSPEVENKLIGLWNETRVPGCIITHQIWKEEL